MPNGINRIDSARKQQHSWLARHFVDGEVISKQFSDSRHGGKEEALKAAQAWLVEQERLRPGRRRDTHAPFQRQKVRSNTGIMGISRTHDFARQDRALKRECFSVAFSDQGVRSSRKFYIDNYEDEHEALADAIQFRREKEREMLAYWKRNLARKARQAQG